MTYIHQVFRQKFRPYTRYFGGSLPLIEADRKLFLLLKGPSHDFFLFAIVNVSGK